MAWRFEHSADSNATPHEVWSRYVDVEHWSEWSPQGVESSHLDGPFTVGTRGKSKPPGRPTLRFELVEVEPDARFVSAARFPGARLRIEHRVAARQQGSRITHSCALDGPLAAVYTWAVRKSIESGLPDSVERLATLAAAKHAEAG